MTVEDRSREPLESAILIPGRSLSDDRSRSGQKRRSVLHSQLDRSPALSRCAEGAKDAHNRHLFIEVFQEGLDRIERFRHANKHCTILKVHKLFILFLVERYSVHDPPWFRGRIIPRRTAFWHTSASNLPKTRPSRTSQRVLFIPDLLLCPSTREDRQEPRHRLWLNRAAVIRCVEAR